MLYLYALRAARPRQLRARALRPLARRRFPGGEPPGEASPIPRARELWASPAFEASSPLDASTRLGRFHRQYGDDVLAAARAGDLAETRRLVATWIEAHPPHDGDAWHPYPLSTRVGNWIAALTLAARARLAGALAQPVAAAAAAARERRGRRARQPRDPQRARARARRHVVRRGRADAPRDRAAAPRAARAGAARRRPLRAQPGVPPRRAARPARDPGRVAALVARGGDRAHARLRRGARAARRRAGALQRRHGRRAAARAARAAPEGLSVFDDSGFVVVRDGPLWLAFRCGARRAGVPAGARARGRAVVSALVARPSGASSTRARSRTSPAPTATGSARRARTRRCASTAATSSACGVRSAAARCRR